MHYARIVDGSVVELFETDGNIAEMFHPSMVWVQCPEATAVGDIYDGAAFSAPVTPPLTPAELNDLKAALKIMIDGAAETERLRYITPGAGQAMTYQRKIEEARAASAEPGPNPADYPLLAASVGIDGPDVAAVAAVVLGMDAAWAQIGAAIEGVRLGTKKAIDEAEDEAAARAAANAAVWPA